MAKRGFLDMPSPGSALCLTVSIMAFFGAFPFGCASNDGIFAFLLLIVAPLSLLGSVVLSVTEGELPPAEGPTGRCAFCGYSLAGLPTARCPECGHLNESSNAEAANDPSS